MGDLDVSPNIFSENGSRYFKNKIAEKKINIPNYSNNELRQEKEHLEYKKIRMIEILNSGNFSPAQKNTYEIYLKDVEDLINAVDARLLEGGTKKRRRKSRTTRKRKGNKGKRKRTRRIRFYK
jgi:hypothetical protein